MEPEPGVARSGSHVLEPEGRSTRSGHRGAAAADGVSDVWPLMGRSDELARMSRVLRRRDRHGVVLAGPPGVGKTRLAAECGVMGGAAGFVTAAATATRAASVIPFGALASLMHRAQPMTERRIDVLQAVRSSLLRRAGEHRLMVVVDDAHLLDEASAAVLHQMAAGGDAFLVLTVRSREPAPDAIVSLWKDEVAERIEVPPLPPAEVESVINEVLGAAVDGAAMRALVVASAGNLLYLREALRGAVSSGVLRCDDGLWRLQGALSAPPSLTELVQARLAEATPDEREVLALLAVGEPLGLDLVVRLTSAALVRAVDRRGLLDLRRDGRRADLGLAHPLFADAMRADLSPVRVAELQRALADAVEATQARRKQDALRIASWRLACGDTVGLQTMVRAARHARAAFDLALAERLARAALASGGGVSAGLVLGETLCYQGRCLEADAALLGVSAAVSDDEERARVALARSFNLFWGIGRGDEAEQVAAAAADRIGLDHWRHELQAERATYRLFAGSPRDALQLASGLLDQPGISLRARARACFAGVPALTVMGRIDEAVEMAEAGSTALQSSGDSFAETLYRLLLRACLSLALTEAGRLDTAERVAGEAYDDALHAGIATAQALLAWSRGRVALTQGRVATAARWFREGSGIDRELGMRSRQRWSPGGLAFAVALLGDVGAADSLLADVDAAATGADRFLETDQERARAWRDVAGGDLNRARARLHAAAQEAAASGQYTLEAAALHDLVRLGEAAHVTGRLGELTAVVDGELMLARARHASASAARDAQALEQAADQFAALGALLLGAEAAAEATTAFRRLGDRRRAASCGRQAHRLSAACEGARTPALRLDLPAAHLTRRETDIAHLAAGGLSSREIAAQLSLSVRTVENHLLHAYEKIGVRGRAELSDVLRPRSPTEQGAAEAGPGSGR